VHFGVILPNFGVDSSPVPIHAFAERAEELGFHSVCCSLWRALDDLPSAGARLLPIQASLAFRSLDGPSPAHASSAIACGVS
jgi:hypothetical protein